MRSPLSALRGRLSGVLAGKDTRIRRTTHADSSSGAGFGTAAAVPASRAARSVRARRTAAACETSAWWRPYAES